MSENYSKIESRVKTVEEAVLLLTDLKLRGEERMDGYDSALTNLTVKLEALADAQIRTEEALKHLTEVQAESQKRLTEAQAHTDQRLDALIDIVREDREGRDGH
jgi:hypothetical protein